MESGVEEGCSTVEVSSSLIGVNGSSGTGCPTSGTMTGDDGVVAGFGFLGTREGWRMRFLEGATGG